MPDLNLLITLDVLLAEGSVARAAQRLRLSPSAMSRALARLRAATSKTMQCRPTSTMKVVNAIEAPWTVTVPLIRSASPTRVASRSLPDTLTLPSE